MTVVQIKLSNLMELQRQFDKPAFAERYNGTFLLAMGFVAADEIKAQTSAAARAGEATTAFSLSDRMRHDAQAKHPLAGQAFYVQPTGPGARVFVGRGEDCEITVPDESVSERHARIEVTDHGVIVTDVGSTNGTAINSQPLPAYKRMLLDPETIVTFGRYSFQLLDADSLHTELALLNALGLDPIA